MDKLTIEHLSAYLPYGVQFISSMDKPFDEFGRQPIWTLNGVHELFDEYSLLTKENKDSYAIHTCKPILRPLSQLTQEIEHNWERFVPSDILEKIFGDISCLTDTMLVGSWCHWGIVQKLLSWHFDLFGLHEKGLAVEKKDNI